MRKGRVPSLHGLLPHHHHQDGVGYECLRFLARSFGPAMWMSGVWNSVLWNPGTTHFYHRQIRTRISILPEPSQSMSNDKTMVCDGTWYIPVTCAVSPATFWLTLICGDRDVPVLGVILVLWEDRRCTSSSVGTPSQNTLKGSHSNLYRGKLARRPWTMKK